MRFLPWLFRKRIRKGSFTLRGPCGFSETFAGTEDGPSVVIRVADPTLDWKILLNPELRFAEAYMAGAIEIVEGDLRDMMALWVLNRRVLGRNPAFAFWIRLYRAIRRFHQNNTVFRSGRNARAHYDIGNDLYRLFLDRDMQYSCAYFARGDETLEEAQLAKKRHIAAKLMLRPGQRVLDIGCGWGGMALYLARIANVEVTGITLAEEQLKVARQRARAEGLAGRVRFELTDYRDLDGQFDRIVSVGMFEHVGAPNLATFFTAMRERLAPDGVALLHSIMSKEPPSYSGPFTRKYIFPGGYVPSASETLAAVERSDLWLLDFEVWRKHYAYTLAEWARRFAANRDKAKAMCEERFCRMWELYLAGAEKSFLSDSLAVMQLQLGRERDAVPLTREYLAAETARLAAREAGRRAA